MDFKIHYKTVIIKQHDNDLKVDIVLVEIPGLEESW